LSTTRDRRADDFQTTLSRDLFSHRALQPVREILSTPFPENVHASPSEERISPVFLSEKVTPFSEKVTPKSPKSIKTQILTGFFDGNRGFWWLLPALVHRPVRTLIVTFLHGWGQTHAFPPFSGLSIPDRSGL
jgi:hypothetical protein